MKKCQECKEVVAVYQCPRCNRRTCSLKCCIAHKQNTGCTGKRDRTKFQRLEEMSDTTLQSDFHFLEDVLSTVDGGKRLMKQVGANARSSGIQSLVSEISLEEQGPNKKAKIERAPLPLKWRRLVQQAKERQTTLLLMPPGMQRHKSNTSQYHIASDVIFWKLEFIMGVHKSTTTLKKVSEDSLWIEEWSKQQKNVDLESLHFLMKKLPCPSNKPLYVTLDRKMTLKEALKGMTIIENPIIEVVVTEDLNNFPRAIQEIDSLTT